MRKTVSFAKLYFHCSKTTYLFWR